MKLLAQETKGSSYRLINPETSYEYRAMTKHHYLIIGSLLTVEITDHYSDLINEMNIIDEIVGDSTKKRVEIRIDEVKIGDLIDGIPVLSL